MNSSKYTGLILSVLYTILCYLSKENIFFGDMVQFGSRHPHYFFENNFNNLWLPNSLDSGHPPAFGIYIALCWKFFGKTLAVSHWAMYPFLLLIAFAIPRLISNYISRNSILIISLIFLFEPTLRSQASLTSPDIVLIAFFMWALIFYKENKNIWLLLVLIPMSFISLRGMMLLFAFYISVIAHQYKLKNKFVFKDLFRYTYLFIPAVLVCFYWLFRHYQITGWIGFHQNSPWASSFQTVGFDSIMRNLFLMIWRFADFGRIAIWVLFIWFVYIQLRKKESINNEQIFPLYLFTSLLIVYSVNTLFADGLVGHRYYMPIFLLGIIIVVQSIERFATKQKNALFSFVIISFILGSKFVYPSKIAMGWDATPAHLPYYELRNEVIAYLEKNNIETNNVAAGFPTIDSRKTLELTSDTSRFQSYHLLNTKYILWSNIFNYPDDLQDSLSKKKVVFENSKGGVFMKLLER